MKPCEILTKARDRLIPIITDGLRITPSLPVKPGDMGLALNIQPVPQIAYLTALFALRKAAGIKPDETLFSFEQRRQPDLALAIGIYNSAILEVQS